MVSSDKLKNIKTVNFLKYFDPEAIQKRNVLGTPELRIVSGHDVSGGKHDWQIWGLGFIQLFKLQSVFL